MTSKKNGNPTTVTRVRPQSTQHAKELQHFGTMAKLPIALEASACATGVENLNVSEVIRANEMHVRFLSEHPVDTPLAPSE